MLATQRSSSQSTLTGMGSLDEELTAMLSSGQHTPGDLFAPHYSSLQGTFPAPVGPGQHLGTLKNASLPKGGLDRLNAPSFVRGLPGRQSTTQIPQWPFASDEKWVLDAKNEALETSSLRSTVTTFGPTVDAPPHGFNPSPPGGLQRYHSAPSAFLQSLTDFNEDAFSQVSSPMGDREGLLNSFFADNLTPIIESGPQQMDTEKVVTSSSLNDYEQFLVSQTDFGRRPTLSPAAQSGKVEVARKDGMVSSGLGGSSVSDTLGVRSRPMKNNLLRQSSSPADLLAAIQDSMDESSPGLHVSTFLSPDESMSGGTSEETAGGSKAKSPSYSTEDCFLVQEAVVSGGVWNNPISPGKVGGNRGRGVGGVMNDSSGLSGAGSLRVKVGEPGSLVRHSSLPTTSRPLSPTMELDDLADFSVPCKTRAKRGFATHPRSIAERVRRTKISERMKRLQDLVPNMDRQTNTADMLDEAVEYVKQLQLQVQELSNTVVQLKELQKAKELKAQG